MEHRKSHKIEHFKKRDQAEYHSKHNRPRKPREHRKDQYVSRGVKSHRSGGLEIESHEVPELDGDGSYVRNWIARMHKESEAGIQNLRAIETPFGQQNVRWKTQQDMKVVGRGDILVENLPTRRKRKRNFSSDSSFLELAEPVTNLQMPIPEKDRNFAQKEKQPMFPLRRNRKAESVADKSSEQYAYRQESFERQPRHKTREDLYDHKKQEKCDRQAEVKRTRKKREKRGDKKRAARKAGEDLMHKFSSKNVDQERLTLRPSHGPGIFLNGRASLPAKHRGLPDLTFSEMDFLQHLTQPRAGAKSAVRAGLFASEKDRRKTLRLSEEMSTFFKPAQNLPERRPDSRDERSISYYSNTTPPHKQNVGLNDMEISRRLSYHLDIPRDEYIGYDQQAPILSQHSRHSQNLTSMNEFGNATDTKSLWSGKATTRVTWSETQVSPNATGKMPDRILHAKSPAPESVRRSIEMSGILNHTGISLTPELRGLRSMLSPTNDRTHFSQKPARINDVPNTSNLVSGVAEPFGNQSLVSSISRAEVSNFDNRSKSLIDQDLEQHTGSVAAATSTHRASSCDGAKFPVHNTKQILVRHFDPIVGWHQNPNTRIHDFEKSSVAPREVESTLINRVEIARKARMKRPSTTLPVVTAGERSQLSLNENQQLFTSAEEVFRSDSLPSVLTKDASHMAKTQATPTIDPNTSAHHDTTSFVDNANEELQKKQCFNAVDVTSKGYCPKIKEKPQSSETKSDFIGVSTLSYRDASSTYHFPMSPRYATRLSPFFESEPLYLNQIQQENRAQHQLTHYNKGNCDYFQAQDRHRSDLLPENLLDLRGTDVGYSADNSKILQLRSMEIVFPSIDQLDCELEAEFNSSSTNRLGDPDLSEHTGRYIGEEIGDLGSIYRAGLVADSANIYSWEDRGSYISNSQYALEEEIMNGALIDGFWRSQTYY